MNKTNESAKQQVEALLEELNEGLYGKEETIRIVLLAILAGESAFLLGEPGTAKSMISRRISDAFEDVDSTLPENKGVVKYYEYLMNQFSTPDEVFGPVSLESLKKDEYKRITDRFLPKAKFAFLDEIWKASPAIQNALLTILNEKKFHNGSSAENVPLMGFIAASNELPQKDAGLEAIFDRFLVRIFEKPISKDSDFFEMITSSKKSQVTIRNKLDEKLISKWQNEADNITLPEECKELIRNIRKTLVIKNKEEKRDDDDKYLVSDRRWKKIVGILKMSAYINGRTEIDLSDCTIIAYCLWSTETQEEEVFGIVADLLVETVLDMLIFFDPLEVNMEFKNIKNECDSLVNTYFENLSNIDFPGGSAELIKHKKDILTQINCDKINNLLGKINEIIAKLEADFAEKTEIFNTNLFFQSKYFQSKLTAAKRSRISELKELSREIAKYATIVGSRLFTDFISLDQRIKSTVAVVNKINEETTLVSKADSLQKVKTSVVPAITEQIEAERRVANEIFQNQKDIFGEALTADNIYVEFLSVMKREIDRALGENEKQIESIQTIIEKL